jgi:hypothetical protein
MIRLWNRAMTNLLEKDGWFEQSIEANDFRVSEDAVSFSDEHDGFIAAKGQRVIVVVSASYDPHGFSSFPQDMADDFLT